MVLYIPIALAILFIVLAVVADKRGASDDTVGAIGGGGVMGSLMIGLFAGMLIITGNFTERDLEVQPLVAIEPGVYVETTLGSDGQHYSFILEDDYSTDGIPTTVGPDDWKVEVVSTEDRPAYVEVQDVIDNGWIWPWVFEGGSHHELRVPSSGIVQK